MSTLNLISNFLTFYWCFQAKIFSILSLDINKFPLWNFYSDSYLLMFCKKAEQIIKFDYSIKNIGYVNELNLLNLIYFLRSLMPLFRYYKKSFDFLSCIICRIFDTILKWRRHIFSDEGGPTFVGSDEQENFEIWRSRLAETALFKINLIITVGHTPLTYSWNNQTIVG